MKKFYGLLALLLLILGPSTYYLNAQADPDAQQGLIPSKDQVKATRTIVGIMESDLYNSSRLDNQRSSDLLDTYIDILDHSRLYFYASDIAEFETYRFSLDDALRAGDLSPAYIIYERYRQRSIERLRHLIKIANGDLNKIDFTIDEYLETDRKDAAWPKDRASMDELWRKRFKAEILSQKLSDKELPAIQETLINRYTNQLKRLDQTKSEDVFQTYINALTTTYDPHSQYFSPRVSENFKINMSLKLQGIGAMLRSEHEFTKIVRLIPGGPAEKSGLINPSDRITGVGQGSQGPIEDVIGWRLDDVVDLIRGPEGSIVRLEVIPATATDDHVRKVISITRDTVKLEEQAASGSVITSEQDGHEYKLGIIEIPSFYADFEAYKNDDPNYRSTTRDVRRILEELGPIDGLIIDLRNNGGGSLEEVKTLTGLFIESGPIVQVKHKDRRVLGGNPEVKYDPDVKIVYSGPLVVMTNRMSASASEIFAGAIQDYGRGLIVGSQTFGKGTVQQIYPLVHGQIKFTSAKYYRISGESTQHRGVIPDITFPPIYNKDDIGESSYPTALPWDTIRGRGYQSFGDISPLLPELQKRHQSRTAADPDFVFLNELIDQRQQQLERSQISLNEAQRRKELADIQSWQLETINKRRQANSLPPLKALDEETPIMDQLLDNEENDFLLSEGGRILIDFIGLSGTPQTASVNK